MEVLIPLMAVIGGLIVLAWSADTFIGGASATAFYAKVPPLLIGMVVVGFGTSAPEMVVSVVASSQGKGALALGNAYGSNIANIGLILGLSALFKPLLVHSRVLKRELPVLAGVTGIAVLQLADGTLSRIDAWILLLIFTGLMAWSVRQGLGQTPDAFAREMDQELSTKHMSLKHALIRLVVGMIFLVASSRGVVWGAVEIARILGISDLIIGLTVVAFGTSLPELASSIAAVRKGEYDIAVGNVIGSNLFNTLAVVGLTGVIRPLDVERAVLTRDSLVMGGLTLSLFVVGYGFGGQGRINRFEGFFLLLAYVVYTAILICSRI
ncbi:MAG TPA: calcium/sodium antiporter [bacterium]|nr:calcium/sodium antiporter [bacterium]